MERRTTKTRTPRELIEATHYEPIDWPWKTVRLERDSLADYRQRPGSANISIAELYHENSKLSPHSRFELAATRTDTDALRQAIAQPWKQLKQRELPTIRPDEQLMLLLADCAQAVGTALFYAVQIRLVANGKVALYDPMRDACYVLKSVNDSESRLLEQALQVLSPPSHASSTGHLILLLGLFARNDLLYGARGYRRTLIEVGCVASELVRQAGRLGLQAKLHFEFVDRWIDDLADADGIEAGTLAIVEIGNERHITKG